jgi:hypothetical protein
VALGDPHLLGVLLLEGGEHLPPRLLEGGENPNVQGWSLSVEFRGRQTKAMLLYLHSWMTVGEMWLARLTTMISFFPALLFNLGRSSSTNHFSKRNMSIQPDLLQ